MKSAANLADFLSAWQKLVDSACPDGRGRLVRLPEVLKTYHPAGNAYVFRYPSDATDYRLQEDPNESGLTATTANELYRYGCTRVSPIAYNIQESWNCEIFRTDDGLFAVSFFNFLGGRLTVSGITMTKNWCGVISDQGIVAQA